MADTVATSGRLADIQVSTDITAPITGFTAIGEELDASLSITRGFHDATNKDSAGFRQKIAGHADANMSGSCNWKDSDAGVDIVLDALESGAKLSARWRMASASTEDEWIGDGTNFFILVTAATLSAPVDGVMTMDFTFEFTGDFSRSDQA